MAYAIILDEYLREGMSLTDALTRLLKWAAVVAGVKEQTEEELVAEMNRRAMREIEGRMGIPEGRGLSV